MNYNPTKKIFKHISSVEAYAIIQANKNNQDFIILDVRTKEEYADKRLENSDNIDFYSKSFKKKLDKLDKNKTYLVYCLSGNRSGQTFEIMKEIGFAEVYDMQEGII